MDPSPTAAGKVLLAFQQGGFFPEPTFTDFPTYLSKTPHRLKDRLLGRSSNTGELVRSKIQLENEMKKCLIWLGLGSEIFSIIGQETRDHCRPAIVLTYAIFYLSTLLSVLCYTEFSIEIPIIGGSFSFLRIELGYFIAAGNILLEGLVGAAGLGRSWSSYVASMIKSGPDFLRIRINSLAQGFNLLDHLAMVVFELG